MRVRLIGHEYKYAVEQMISTLFPGEKPEYCSSGTEEMLNCGQRGMIVSVSPGSRYITAVCSYFADGKRWNGRAAAPLGFITGETETGSVCQKIIKTAIYRAVLRSGYTRPPWGSLTGVRPGKLMSGIMRVVQNRERAVERFTNEYDVSRERAELCYETSCFTEEAAASLTDRDICLYVGIPFCPTRCAYCSFVSQSVEKSMALIEPFLEALYKEIRATARKAKELNLNVVAIYMGGGTPTTLSAEQLDGLCSELAREFNLSALREYTVEAGRPDTITSEKLAVLKKHGIDRVSVNPQTMRNSVLEAIGRKHTAEDIISALETVRAAGDISINMDIIAGLPTDTPKGFRETVDAVLRLNPENITVHTLSLKRGSGIIRNGTEIPDATEVSVMLEYAYRRLREQGYSPYYLYRQKNMSGGFENTGWTKPGHVNLYNICMMEELCTILAMGGGGSTKLIRTDGAKNSRITAPKYPTEYIQQIDKTCCDKNEISDFYTRWWEE